jgi:hypothetical protein
MHMTLGSSFLLLPQNISVTLLFFKFSCQSLFLDVCQSTHAELILLKLTSCSLVFLYKQLSNLNNLTVNVTSNVTLSPVPQARNLGVLFDYNSSFSGHISSITKPCFSRIRDFRPIRPILDQTTAPNIANVLVHSKLDYFNSSFLNLLANKLHGLQFVLSSAARVVSKTPRFHHINPNV